MNQRFADVTQSIPALFDQLVTSPYFTEKGIAVQRGRPGIYVFYEDDEAVHVGRTRDLAQRLRGHISRSHYSATFAFKRARRELGKAATYTVKGSRAELLKDPEFAATFYKHIDLLKKLHVRFIEVQDPVQQYLLELYAHLEFELPLDEFDTH
jgi:predicted GIY-YIG superfamily endonuclease